MVNSTPTPIDRKHPAVTTIKERYLLTKPSSSKQTLHISLRTDHLPLSYKVGDSIGIYPKNDPLLVDLIVKALGLTGNELITDPRSHLPLSFQEYLSSKTNLSE